SANPEQALRALGLVALAETMERQAHDALSTHQANEILLQSATGQKTAALSAATQMGLLVETPDGSVRFLHPAMRRYLCALALRDRLGESKELVLARENPALWEMYVSAHPEPERPILNLLRNGDPSVANLAANALRQNLLPDRLAKAVRNLKEAGIPAETLRNLGAALMEAGEAESGAHLLRALLPQEPAALQEAHAALPAVDLDHPERLLDATRLTYYLDKGILLRLMGESERAQAELQRAQDEASAVYAVICAEQGLIHLAEGRDEEALSQFRLALARQPNVPEHHYWAGVALNRLGRPGEAIERLQKASALLPNNPEILAELGRAYQHRGWLGEALAAYQQAAQLAPQDGHYLRLAALVMAEQGLREAAVERMQQAIALQPDRAQWYDELGTLLADADDWQGARARFREAVELSAGDAEYLRHLAQAESHLGRRAAAIELYRRALESRP
ncbi:MAG: tetratricopeptide repeat protein, partial [Anaerolineae bacterium]